MMAILDSGLRPPLGMTGSARNDDTFVPDFLR